MLTEGQICKKPRADCSVRGSRGGYLLSHFRSTIGVVRLNFSVRNGKRWIPHAIATLVPFCRHPAASLRLCRGDVIFWSVTDGLACLPLFHARSGELFRNLAFQSCRPGQGGTASSPFSGVLPLSFSFFSGTCVPGKLSGY